MFIFVITTIVFLVLWLVEKNKHKKDNAAHVEYQQTTEARIAELAKYEQVVDAAAEAKRLTDEAKADRLSAQTDAINIRATAHDEAANIHTAAQNEAVAITAAAREEAKSIRERANAALQKAEVRLRASEAEAAAVLAGARMKAEEIAGDAIKAKENADTYEATVIAMRNTIKGYGDEWLKPTYSILVELADEMSYTEAGQKLKEARAHSTRMVKEHLAASCDYVEESRKQTAIDFVIDAFNGKVDSILSKSKQENHGKLEQQIRDAYALVNYNGKAFRNARIQEEYLDARLQELHWAVIVKELRAKELEEQRELREKIREEEKARRDFERAQRAAEKEEAMLKKAMEKAQAMLEKANEEQRAQYEVQLADLTEKLKEAEEKAQRALSMAQQTKHGNVYVISNVGSFGENVYKVGMTRRLDPMDRVRELGDASVPFRFDVHAIIESDDAPALEHALHQDLALMQMNKVNPRKEFFRVPLSDIRALVERHGAKAIWTMTAEAAEYRETLAIEEQMRTDPAMKEKWMAYAQSVSESEDEETQSA